MPTEEREERSQTAIKTPATIHYKNSSRHMTLTYNNTISCKCLQKSGNLEFKTDVELNNVRKVFAFACENSFS